MNLKISIGKSVTLTEARLTVLHRIYLLGYQQRIPPRWLRCFFAKTEFHRAWLIGSKGFFSEDGIKYGPARPYHHRKQLEPFVEVDIPY